MDEELRYKVAVTMFQGIGPQLINRLVEQSGCVESFFKEKKCVLENIPDLRHTRTEFIDRDEALARADREIEFCVKNGIRIITPDDGDYPYRLLQCPDFPQVVYCKGGVNLNHDKVLAMVGTRRATLYGRTVCNDIVSGLKDDGHDILIVSGLAYGIDVASHKAALDNGFKTVGVVAHGLNQLYPAAHKNVAREMVESGGAILSDFSTLASAEPRNFLKRNRIIAGLSDAVLVVESAEKGGSMITATLGNSYDRDVLAVPGKCSDRYSRGCNKLIKDNKAALVESSQDVEFLMNWELEKKVANQQLELPIIDLNGEESKVYDFLKNNGKSMINDISKFTSIPIGKLSTILLTLELKNLLFSLPGNIYTVEI